MLFFGQKNRQVSEPVVTATVDEPVPVESVPASTTREQLLEEALIALADYFGKGMGDLTRPVTLGSDDPAVRRAEADVQAFVDQVRDMRMRMEEMTAQASMAAATSGHQMGAVAGTMAESHSQLEQAAQGVEQSQTGVSEVARAAASTAALAEEAEQRTTQGAVTIQHAIQSIGEIQADIQVARDKVGALATRSEQIIRVSALIDGIAQRTNLLALNAAIEAARAGQHGRGFGVVAEEIRRLAESTAGQTREIRGLITAISVDLKETEAAIEGSKLRADQGVSQAAEAGQALVEIQDLVKRAAEPVTEIAGLAEEQSAALEQVTASLQEMSRGIGAVSNQAKQVSEVTANLAGITEQGYSVLNRFNCGSHVDTLTVAGRRIVADVQAVLEGVVDSGAVSLGDLLAFEYFEYKGHHLQKLKRLMGDISKVPLDGFTPKKFGTAYDSLVDVELRDLMDRHLEETKGIGFLVLSDLNGYSPAQNKRYCQPWTGEEKIDFHSRVKRMNCDVAQVRGSRMGLNWVEREPLEIGVATDHRNPNTIHSRQEFLAAGLDLTEPAGGDWSVLVQTFTRRLTGTVVNILSLPLYVKGQRYGAVIVGWLPARDTSK